ncbi:MAG: DUF1207 domain-containing protein [Thermoguttaceae bacterium]
MFCVLSDFNHDRRQVALRRRGANRVFLFSCLALLIGLGGKTNAQTSPSAESPDAPVRLPSVVSNSNDAANVAIADARVADSTTEHWFDGKEPWTWQLLPDGLMYPSYLAGNKEPRLGSQWVHLRNRGWQWDPTLGGRVGLLRFGTMDSILPQGWQWDIEGTALIRMNMEHDNDVDHVDYRAGAPLTTRQGPWEFKFGYYHLSSHLGDEYMARNDTLARINYVRETLAFGAAVRPTENTRLYSEVGWAFYVDGGAQPWEIQFGMEFSSTKPSGRRGDPFFAVNCHLHEETDFSGNLTVQTGWQWRGRSGHLFRIGMQYFNGMSELAQFYNTFEEQIGLGVWYDF